MENIGQTSDSVKIPICHKGGNGRRRYRLGNDAVDVNALIDLIREQILAGNKPTAYSISKIAAIDYRSIHQICKTLEFAGVFRYRLEITPEGSQKKIMYLPNDVPKIVPANQYKEEPTPQTKGAEAFNSGEEKDGTKN